MFTASVRTALATAKIMACASSSGLTEYHAPRWLSGTQARVTAMCIAPGYGVGVVNWVDARLSAACRRKGTPGCC